MSLKSQLRISIVTLVALLVLSQCVLSLRIMAEDKFRDALERAQSISNQVGHLVLQRVNEQAMAVDPRPATIEEIEQVWRRVVENDAALPSLLAKSMASSSVVIEIMICDDSGLILASSTPSRQRLTYQSLPDFMQWKERPLWDRLTEVMTQTKDYAMVVPLGASDSQKQVLTIRVVVSSVLIRDAIVPQVMLLAGVSTLTMLASVLLAYLFSNVVLRSLDRLSRRIDSITTGQFSGSSADDSREAKEFAEVQSKLDVLSQQFRGAREDMVQLRNNIEVMLERLEEGVLLFDPGEGLQRISRSAEDLLGLEREDVAGKPLSEIFPASSELGAVLRHVVNHQRAVRDVPVTWDSGSGSARLLVNVELLESLPEPGRFSLLLTLRDAEMRHQIRSQLDISTRLAAISRLTGGVAHEIKNPLNAIALHLEILKSKLAGDARVEREVEVIGGEISRLDRVVKTFLDFTRPVDLRLHTLNLVEAARQVAALVWPEAERAKVSIELDSPRSAAFIRGDEDLIKQALLNVINNGIESMKNGGRLRIRVFEEDEDVVVTVVDQGAGIPPEIREKIFNLYFTTKEKGTGIGLAMTFRVIQLHNATMDFTSEPGEGTTFFMRFPAVEGEEPLPTPPAKLVDGKAPTESGVPASR